MHEVVWACFYFYVQYDSPLLFSEGEVLLSVFQSLLRLVTTISYITTAVPEQVTMSIEPP